MILLRRLALGQYKAISHVDLAFPDRGSFLIEGLNEAGKSTLFDGAYFALYGTPLVGDLADAVQYGADQAFAEVEVDVEGTHLRVKRRVLAGGKTSRADAELWVMRGGDAEYVRGRRPVSTRLLEELGGLTPTALLNSCFVAQKQLGRLETLARQNREEALMVLLNLSKLTDVHDSLRVGRELEQELQRAQLRLQVAQRSAELQSLEEKLDELRRRRALGALRDAVDEVERLCERRAQLETKLTALTTQRMGLEQAVQAARGPAAALRQAEATEAALREAMRAQARLLQLVQEEVRLREAVGRLCAAADAIAGLDAELLEVDRRVAEEERQRKAAARRERLLLAAERVAAWLRLARRRDELATARRLLGDLSLAVQQVRLIPGTDGAPAALELELLFNHPAVPATTVRLRLSGGTASVLESRPADSVVGRGRSAASLWGADGLVRDLERELLVANGAVRQAGVQPPKTIPHAQRIAAAIEAEVQAVAGVQAGDEAEYQRWVGRAQSLRDQIGSLRAQGDAGETERRLEARTRERLVTEAALRESLPTLDNSTHGLPTAEELDARHRAAAARVAELTGVASALREQELRLQQLADSERGMRNDLARVGQDVEAAAARANDAAAELSGTRLDIENILGLGEAARRAHPELGQESEALDNLETTLEKVKGEFAACETRLADLRIQLGDEVPLSLEEAQASVRELELQRRARLKALEVLAITRRRMIEKILPSTVDNMCALLPLLTAGRYHYADLTPEYQLRVWDERKRGHVEKNLFSGGTQDQFSLGLRLGFALAALPRELGTSPGFLFLDEPLSSFDRDRTAALVDLVTRGQIALYFRQIVLISHSQAFDPALFSYHVEMEDGRVVHSTLPVAR